MLLHGRGADEHDLLPLLEALDPERRLVGVTPRGPLSLPPGGAHWYVVRSIGFPDSDTFHETYDQLSAWFDSLPERTGSADRAHGARRVLAGRGHVVRARPRERSPDACRASSRCQGSFPRSPGSRSTSRADEASRSRSGTARSTRSSASSSGATRATASPPPGSTCCTASRRCRTPSTPTSSPSCATGSWPAFPPQPLDASAHSGRSATASASCASGAATADEAGAILAERGFTGYALVTTERATRQRPLPRRARRRRRDRAARTRRGHRRRAAADGRREAARRPRRRPRDRHGQGDRCSRARGAPRGGVPRSPRRSRAPS